MFSESLQIAGMGGTVGLLLAQWIAQAGFRLATDDTGVRAIDLTPDRWMLVFTASLSMIAGLVVGAGTVLRASRTNPQQALRNVGSPGSARLSKVLLVAQIAFTIALVGTAALFLQTLSNFRRIELVSAAALMTVTMDAGLGSFEAPSPLYRTSVTASVLAWSPAFTVLDRAIALVCPEVTLDYPFLGAPHRVAGPHLRGHDFVRPLLNVFAQDLTRRIVRRRFLSIVNESSTYFFGTSFRGRTFRFVPGFSRSDHGVVRYATEAKRRPAIISPPCPTEIVRDFHHPPAATLALQTCAATKRLIQPSYARSTVEDSLIILRRERLLAALVGFVALAVLLLASGWTDLMPSRAEDQEIASAPLARRMVSVWMINARLWLFWPWLTLAFLVSPSLPARSEQLFGIARGT